MQDICHRCHDTIDVYTPIVYQVRRDRAYHKDCFQLIRIRYLSRLVRLLPNDVAFARLDALPKSVPG
jgi:hypothetical protein